MSRNTEHVKTLQANFAWVTFKEGQNGPLAAALHAAIAALKPDNGFANRETLMASVHVDQNQWTQNKRKALLAQAIATENDSEVLTKEQHTLKTFAALLKDWIEGLSESFFTEGRSCQWRKDVGLMVRDVGSLWRVDWRELAEHWIELDAEG